ncbi:DUF1015 domain-containing protein [Endomicrobium proavitum]|uniref:DUF1015 domain-containing protein n=1 Tax=Endomicrobium proavitum TaxID=1408281 RepID=A0A0G3WL50_9BACT|nr:DUF1015 domain-containing protein [Endomicrobium proavitum]AKL98610.1 hypothetical protein Epro_1231 [Endomicrobium proavitum]
MAEVKPFNAVRYSKETITNFICPPYDVISSQEKERLKKLSPYNIINIELSDPKGKKNKYAHAADIFKQWIAEGVLVRDSKPAYYFYEQIFEDHGIKMTRRGFFGALKLDNPHSGKGSVKPHEKTLAGPKADRLKLLKAVKANVSPIFGLFDDEKNTIVKLCVNIARKSPSAVAKDTEGTFHKLWVVTDEDVLESVEKYLSSKKMFIADGHHRYETAWNYSQERKAKDKKYSPNKDYNYVLAYLCPMEDPGISIWPTHRVIAEPADLEENIEKYFDVHSAKDFARFAKKEIQPLLLFKDGKYRTLTIKKEALLKKAMPNKGKAYRNLAVSALHYILIPKIDASEFVYVKSDKEAVNLAQKTKKIAIIVPATPVASLKAISLNNEMMPQKSTYFYPKLASGIVIKTV